MNQTIKSSKKGNGKSFFLDYIDIIITAIFYIIITILTTLNVFTDSILPVYLFLVLLIVISIRNAKYIRPKIDDICSNLDYIITRIKEIETHINVFDQRIERLSSSQLSDMETNLQQLLTQVAGFTKSEVILGIEAFYEKLLSIYQREDVYQVDVTYFTPNAPNYALPYIKKYWESLYGIFHQNKQKKLRRIATIENKNKFLWLTEDLQKNKKSENYSVNIVPNNAGILLLNTIMINNDEVFIFGPHRPENERLQTYVYIKSNEIGKAVASYYDLIWSKSIRIKEGNVVHNDLLERIKNNLPSE